MKKPKKYEINGFIERIENFKEQIEEAFKENHLPNDYWGLCPECVQDGEFNNEILNRNVNRDHYMCCDKHKTFWWIGSNLFSHWREESPDTWKDHIDLLKTYTRVESVGFSHLFNLFEIENLQTENARLKEMLKEKTGIDIDVNNVISTEEALEPF